MQTFNPDTMRARFHEAGREKEAVRASVANIRLEYETLRAEINARQEALKPLEQQLLTAEGQVATLDRERAALAKFLGGRTGRGSVSESNIVVPLVQAFGSVDDARASYLRQIKLAADQAHNRLGLDVGISLTYQEKKDQALAVLGLTPEEANGRGSDFPLVAASVPTEAENIYAAATLIMQRYEAWTEAAAALEEKRLKAEKAIRDAQDVDSVRAAAEAVSWA